MSNVNRKWQYVEPAGNWQALPSNREGEVMAEQPSLGGQLEAFIRQGAKDLHNAIVPAFPESQRGVDEMGTPLAPTPQMVDKDLDTPDRGYEAMLSQYRGQAREQEQELERE